MGTIFLEYVFFKLLILFLDELCFVTSIKFVLVYDDDSYSKRLPNDLMLNHWLNNG